MNQWIAVRKELPKKAGFVIAFAPSADGCKPFMETVWYDPNSGCVNKWNLVDVWAVQISHWMELPEAP